MMNNRQPRGFDIALICENGHIINTMMQTSPQYNVDYCQDCGANTVSACPSCGEPIRGVNLDSRVYISMRSAPKYCHKCGAPFIWTEREQQTLLEYVDEFGNLSEADRDNLQKSIVVLSTNAPEAQTQLAAARFKKVISKLGNAVGEVVYKMVVDVASETGKKILLP